MKTLRLYESAQGTVVGLCGAAVHGWHGLKSADSILLLVAIFLQLLSIFTYNDACDEAADRDNPRKRADGARPGSRVVAAASLAAFAACSLALPARSAAPLWAAALAGWLYSDPRTYLKSRVSPSPGGAARRWPWAQLTHALVAACYFIAGASLDGAGLGAADALAALLFTLMIVGGNLYSELLDVRSDQRHGVTTTAVLLGPRRALDAVLLLHALALALGTALCPPAVGRALALCAVLLYAAAAARVRPNPGDAKALADFRGRYRAAFGALTLAWLISRPDNLL